MPVSRVVAKQRIMPISYWRPIAAGRRRDETVFLEAIRARLGTGIHAIPIGRARAGIYLLAKTALRGARRKVLMSPYTIPDLAIMVELAGGEPVFYDFEPHSTSVCMESLKQSLDDQTACVIVTHYHVNEHRLDDIAALCRANGAMLIDDCAISFGGTVNGNPIGTLTDAGVFSFSSFKLLNYFWGGLITTRNPELAEGLTRIVESWPRLRAMDYAPQAKVCVRYDAATRPILFGSVVFPMIRNRFRRSTEPGGLDHVRIESTELDATLTSRPAAAAFSEWKTKLEKVDAWLNRRRSIAAIYRRHLSKHMVGRQATDAVLAGSCFVNFPVVTSIERNAEIVRAMILAGYDVGRNLYPNVHRHARFSKAAGASSNVDELVASSIYLPTHFGVSEQYAEEIAERLRTEIER